MHTTQRELWTLCAGDWLLYDQELIASSLIARFMGPTWGLPGADRTQVDPLLAPWTLLSGLLINLRVKLYGYLLFAHDAMLDPSLHGIIWQQLFCFAEGGHLNCDKIYSAILIEDIATPWTFKQNLIVNVDLLQTLQLSTCHHKSWTFHST